jgi:8-oxo-dGTP pyrophosphatase MutT (NUDIX family)
MTADDSRVRRVEVDRPGPGEELNTGAVTVPRVAASVIVLRDSDSGPEVLLVQRNPAARFMGGAWVFPGGAVKDQDGNAAATGVRELEEEAALVIDDGGELVPWSRWITPAQVKIRFDTWFFVARAPADAAPRCDGEECIDVRWLRPQDALDAYARDELLLVFPTIRHLQELAMFESVDPILETGRARRIQPIEPRVVLDSGGVARVLLPGEPGYDDAPVQPA